MIRYSTGASIQEQEMQAYGTYQYIFLPLKICVPDPYLFFFKDPDPA